MTTTVEWTHQIAVQIKQLLDERGDDLRTVMNVIETDVLYMMREEYDALPKG